MEYCGAEDLKVCVLFKFNYRFGLSPNQLTGRAVSAASGERRQPNLQKQSFSLFGYNSYFSISNRSVAEIGTDSSTDIEKLPLI